MSSLDDYLGPHPQRIILLDYLLFSFFFRDEGWKLEEDLHTQFYKAVQEYLSTHRDGPMIGIVTTFSFYRSYTYDLKPSNFVLDPENEGVYVSWNEGDEVEVGEDKLYSLNKMEILVSQEEALTVQERRDRYYVPLSLAMM